MPLPRLARVGIACWLIVHTGTLPATNAAVLRERLPDNAVQPQVALDGVGGLHRIWLSGDPKSGDIYYQKAIDPSLGTWSSAVRVNTRTGAAIAIGTVRGARLAIGSDLTVHVLWNGSSASKLDDKGNVPLLYARRPAGATPFEPERNLLGASYGLDGGAALVSTADGGVAAVWHGSPSHAKSEGDRQVYVAFSPDGGVRFEGERAIAPQSGTCGCCGLSATLSAQGKLLILYRQAIETTQRGMALIVSDIHGEHAGVRELQPWPTATCPMSTSTAIRSHGRSQISWETEGKISVAALDASGQLEDQGIVVSKSTGSKHPALATNDRGETLVCWTEGTGWQRGGRLSWVVLDAKGQPTVEKGSQPGIPVWGHPAAYAKPSGDFVILY